MLRLALIFFAVSLVAGFFGFTGVAEGARAISKTLFFVFIVLCVLFLVVAFAIGSSL